MNRVRARIKLTDNERNALNQLARSTTVIHGLAIRSKILLYAEREQNNTVVAKKLDIAAKTVSLWTHRWNDTADSQLSIFERLSDTKRSGKRSSITSDQLCQFIALACDNPADYNRPISHWTRAELANEAVKQGLFKSLSPSYAGQLLKVLELKPHKNKYWLHKKPDEFRDEKIKVICELYQQAPLLKKRNRCH